MSSFLNNEVDIIIFCSCIGGAAVILIMVALIGCFWDQCTSFKSKNIRRKENSMYSSTQRLPVNISTVSHPHLDHDEKNQKQYPPWLYDTMISEQMNTVERYIKDEPKDENKLPNGDPLHYINKVFSDVYQEEDEMMKKKKTFGYEKPNRMKKPNVSIGYPKDEQDIANENVYKDEVEVFMKKEAIKPKDKKTSESAAVLLDDFDLDLFDLESEKESQDEMKLYFPNDYEIEEKIKPTNIQTVDYENSEENDRDRLEKLEQEVLQHKELGIPVEDDFFDHVSMDSIDYRPPRLASTQPSPVFPRMKENVTHDSFLY